MTTRRPTGRGNFGFGHKLPSCFRTGKVRFRDRRQAQDALQPIAWRRVAGTAPARRQEVRAYECDSCDGWHLTSIATWLPTDQTAS